MLQNISKSLLGRTIFAKTGSLSKWIRTARLLRGWQIYERFVQILQVIKGTKPLKNVLGDEYTLFLFDQSAKAEIRGIKAGMDFKRDKSPQYRYFQLSNTTQHNGVPRKHL